MVVILFNECIYEHKCSFILYVPVPIVFVVDLYRVSVNALISALYFMLLSDLDFLLFN